MNNDSTAENLRPIEVESPQPEERGRGLVANSGTAVEPRTDACVQKNFQPLTFNFITKYPLRKNTQPKNK